MKQEKKTGGVGNKENIEEEAVDDPSPAPPAAKPAKAKRGAQAQFYQRQGVQPPVQASGRAS